MFPRRQGPETSSEGGGLGDRVVRNHGLLQSWEMDYLLGPPPKRKKTVVVCL